MTTAEKLAAALREQYPEADVRVAIAPYKDSYINDFIVASVFFTRLDGKPDQFYYDCRIGWIEDPACLPQAVERLGEELERWL